MIRQAKLPVHERPGFDALYDDDSPFAIPVRTLVPNLVYSLEQGDDLAMRYRLALLALAWEEFREANGVYPAGPQALTVPRGRLAPLSPPGLQLALLAGYRASPDLPAALWIDKGRTCQWETANFRRLCPLTPHHHWPYV